MVYIKKKFNIKSLSLYEQEELCFRDFSRLYERSQGLGISCSFFDKEELIKNVQQSDISFITGKAFRKLAEASMFSDIAARFTLVLDEFDSLVFKTDLSAPELAPIKKFKRLIGFTGSQLQIYHA